MPTLFEAIAQTARESRGRPIAWSEAEVEYVVQTNAGHPANARAPWRAGFEELLALVRQMRGDGPVVYLDTTTIWTALRLAEGDSTILGGLTLMDLDKVTRAVVLNDRVFHLPSDHIDTEDLNRRLGETVFVPLAPVRSDDELARVLWDIWYFTASSVTDTAGEPATPEAADRRHLMADTASFHGVTLADDDWRIEPDSIGGFSSLPASLVRNLITEQSDRPEPNFLLRFSAAGVGRAAGGSSPSRRRLVVGAVRELVYRATFHQLLADALGLIYDPSIARVPALGHLIRNSNEIALATADIDVLHDLVYPQVATTAEALGAVSGPVPVPPVTAYALRQVSNLDQWWHVVAELRGRSAKYRRIRHRLQRELLVGDVATLARLRAELDGSAVAMADPRVDSSLAAGAQAAGAGATLLAGPPAAFAGPLLQMLQLIIAKPTKSAVAAIRRRLTPELRLFHDIAQSATAYSRLHNQIRLLWNVAPLPDSILDLNDIDRRLRDLTRP